MTKQLVSLNEKLIAQGEKAKLNMVLVGYDDSKEGNEGYAKGLNFPAVKVAGRKDIQDLLKAGSTGFIPNIVLFKADGTMVSNDKAEVMKKITELAGS